MPINCEIMNLIPFKSHRFSNGFCRSYEYWIKLSMATQELETLFDQADKLLNQRLDNLMKIFVNRDPNFYYGYLKGRVIVDY